MKTETFSGTIENAYGNPLPSPVKFNGNFSAYETIEEVRTANVFPSDKEIIAFINSKEKANERQKSMTAALTAAGIQKPTLEDPAVQYRDMVKILTVSGKSQAEAEKVAAAVLGHSGK